MSSLTNDNQAIDSHLAELIDVACDLSAPKRSVPYHNSVGSTQAPTTSFTLLLKLPRELQLKIWEHAAFEPQVIRLETHIEHPDEPEGARHIQLKVKSAPPTILHACAVAREVALTIYKKWSIHTDEADWTAQNTIFLNPFVDTIIVKIASRLRVVDDTPIPLPAAPVLVAQQPTSWTSAEAVYSLAYRTAEDASTERFLVVKSPEAWKEMVFVSIYNVNQSIAVEELFNLGLRPYCYQRNKTISGTWGGAWKQFSL